MKDKITYLVAGLLIATIIMLIANKTSSVIAHNENEVFNNLVIKGTLTVGEGNNKIILKNDSNSEIIIQSNKTAISIKASPNESVIVLIPDITETKNMDRRIPSSIGIISEKNNGITKSDITVVDSKGITQIRTDKNLKK